MNKVISLALFDGPTPVDASWRVPYIQFLPAFVRAHHELFPVEEGWELVIHTDTHADQHRLLRCYEEAGLLRTQPMEPVPLTKAMLWRMMPVLDFQLGDGHHCDTEVVFCRDIDSLPTPRDKKCCDDFLASNASAHTILDSPYHANMMGGLCGFKTEEFRQETGIQTLADLYAMAGDVDWDARGTDQQVLNEQVAPKMKILQHGVGQGPRGSFIQARSIPLLADSPANALTAHMGAAGFDVGAAVTYYDALGGRVIDRIRKAEARAVIV